MVYNGPSLGCKSCRTRRVKCDQTKPACNNCTRRRQECPGYADVFDGAHRSQNEVVLRKAGKGKRSVGKAARGTTSTTPSSPDDDESTDQARSTSSSTTPSARSTSSSTTPSALTIRPKSSFKSEPSSATPSSSSAGTHRWPSNSLQWIPYTVDTGQNHRESLEQTSESNSSDEAESAITTMESAFESSPYLIPTPIQQDGCDAAVLFFFHHYVGQKTGSPTRLGFNQQWQPSYHKSIEDSSLRLATTAVGVNITMMWGLQGCDTQLPRSLFLRAVAATRQAVIDPVQSLSDELLMTILVFDLYDDILLHYRQGLHSHGTHKRGALALVNHRGALNYQSLQASHLLDTVRSSLLNYHLSRRLSFSPAEIHLFGRAETVSPPVGTLDMASMPLAQALGELWAYREKRYRRTPVQRREFYQQIITRATDVLKALENWSLFSIEPEFRAVHVPRESVLPSIVSAGMYGDQCAVWDNLTFGNIWNSFAIRNIYALQLIRQALADEPTLLLEAKYRTLLTDTDLKIQGFADQVLSSVPFHLGDTMVLTNPLESSRINYPFTFKINPVTGLNVRLPNPRSDHPAIASASAGWYLYPKIVTLYRLAEPEDDAVPFPFRQGQLEWIKGQVARLQRIFLFVDPPWFKRLVKAPRVKSR